MKTRFKFAFRANPLRFVNNILKEYLLTKEERELIALLQSQQVIGGPTRALVQVAWDFCYLAKIPFFFRAFSQITSQIFSMDFVDINISFKQNRSFKDLVIQNFIRSPLERRKWRKFFAALGEGSLVLKPEQVDLGEACRSEAKRIFNALKSPRDLENLHVHDIYVGDLVYDTYLRCKHRPTVDLRCPFLLELLQWTLFLIAFYQDQFRKTKYSFYLTSYASYIQHGVGVRVALKLGIPVYDLLAAGQLVVQLKSDFPYHRRNHHIYKKWLQEIDPIALADGIQTGHAQLKKRLGGAVDSATYYMRQSAYAYSPAHDVEKLLPPKKKKTIVFMAHDFFDSPHIYGSMLFPDFAIWLKESLAEVSKLDFEILIKPHPNGIDGNAQIHAAIAQEFPNVLYLPHQVSTLQLAQRGVELFVTVYGTIAHEMAYQGLPVLCAGENPHSGFSFTHTPKDLQEYFKILCHPELVKRPPPESDEVASYYFVHNYRTLAGEPQLFPPTIDDKAIVKVLSPTDQSYETRQSAIRDSILRVDKI